MSHLTHVKKDEQEYRSPRSTRSLLIVPKKSGGVKIVQEVEDQVRVLNLFKREVSKIARNYGDFLHLLEEMEEEKEFDGESDAESIGTQEGSEYKKSEEKMSEAEPSEAVTDK